MCDGLLKHPNDAYKLSDVWELASDLDAGRTPRRVCSASSSGSSQLFVGGSEASKDEDQQMEDGEEGVTSEADDDSVIGRDDETVAGRAI
jgi:hypothetical protein